MIRWRWQTPLPAALPLFATGFDLVAVIALAAWRIFAAIRRAFIVRSGVSQVPVVL